MIENRTTDPLDPSPDCDCHMSKSHNVDLQSVTPQEAFESTQVRCLAVFTGTIVTILHDVRKKVDS